MKFKLKLVLVGLSLIAQMNAQPSNIKIAVISDLNTTYGSTTYPSQVVTVVNKIIADKPDLILIAGDMIAGQGSGQTETTYRSMWDGFETAILTPIANSGIPLAVTFGNHDTPNSGFEDAVAKEYWTKWKSIMNLTFDDDANFPFYYSFTFKGHYFFVWETNTLTVSATHLTWLDKIMASTKAKEAAFRVGMGHIPFFWITKEKADESISNYTSVITKLENNNVNLYITGHMHAFYPGVYPSATKNIHYVMSGCVGDGERKILLPDGTNAPAFKEYTFIELPADNSRAPSIKGYRVSDNSLVGRSSLPASVVYTKTVNLDPTYLDANTAVPRAPIKTAEGTIPKFNELLQNYPNPFNPETSIKYSIAENSQVSIVVVDMLGRKVKELVNEYKCAGTYSAAFDASELVSGMYMYIIKAGSYTSAKKMILVK